MRNLKQKIMVFATVAALSTSGVSFLGTKPVESIGSIEVQASENTGLNVDYHSQEEISAYINAHSSAMNFSTLYTTQPSTKAPYSMGEVSATTQNNAVQLLNIIRYVAGIPYNVTADSKYITYAQAAALVNASNGVLTHDPSQPQGMASDLYKLGSYGAGSSNLSVGYQSLCAAIKDGWMPDHGSNNISTVGHRRWCLNPTMGKTGFGSVGRYTAMYVFDDSNTNTKYYSRVAWPAQNTPTSLFSSNDLWSISMGHYVNSAQVTLKCVNNGKTYSFNSSSADGDFYVNNQGYGQTGCIIFRPSGGTPCTAGYTYNVDITGKDGSGKSFHVNYNVNFFDTSSVSTLKSQWMQSNGKWWYRNADGSYVTGWKNINSKWYLFDQSGWMLTNWQYTGGKWYYLDSNGAMVTGWKLIGGKWYYFDSDGSMAVGWRELKGEWYYLDSDGSMAVGWREVKGKWYYLDSNGAMVTGWNQINGKTYFFELSGEMAID